MKFGSNLQYLRKLHGNMTQEKLAERMIAYREKHGQFRAAEDLLEVDGIGESKLADMEEWIILEEEAER